MHRANIYVSIQIYTEIVVCSLNHNKEEVQVKVVFVLYFVKTATFYSNFGEWCSSFFLTDASIDSRIYDARDIIIVICSEPCSANH